MAYNGKLIKLEDTAVEASVADKEILSFNLSSGRWINRTFSELGLAPIDPGTSFGSLSVWNNTKWVESNNITGSGSMSYSDGSNTSVTLSNQTNGNYVVWGMYRSRAVAANLANADIVGIVQSNGRVNGTSGLLTQITSIYTGDGTTTKGKLSFYTANNPTMTELLRLQEGSVYFPSISDGFLRVTSGLLSSSSSAASPAGSNTQVQWNNSGSFGADANLTYDPTGASSNGSLSVGAGSSKANINGLGQFSGTYFLVSGANPQIYFAGSTTAILSMGLAYATSDGAILSYNRYYGNDNVGTPRYSADMSIISEDAYTSSAYGSSVVWKTVLEGGTTLAERLKITKTGSIRFNNAYEFPTSIGTVGYALRVPASGSVLEWFSPSSGVSVSNQAVNRIVTASATTDALVAQTYLTFDGSMLKQDGNASVYHYLRASSATPSTTSFLAFCRQRGSIGSATAVQDGDVMADIEFWGCNGTADVRSAYIEVLAEDTYSGSLSGSSMHFYTGLEGYNSIGERFAITKAGAIKFNNAYTFPTSDGTSGYVLKTNGSGTVSWAAAGGGGSSNVSVNNQAAYRIVTSTATTDVLNGEAYLTFDGSYLSMTGSLVSTKNGTFTTEIGVYASTDRAYFGTSQATTGYRGLIIANECTGSGTITTNTSGINGFVGTTTGSTADYTNVASGGAFRNRYFAEHRGTGTVTEMAGISVGAMNDGAGSGNVTAMSAINIEAMNTASGKVTTNSYSLRVRGGAAAGTVTNRYGLYMEDLAQGSTLRYAIYTAGASDTIYFAGKVGIGYAYPEFPLNIAVSNTDNIASLDTYSTTTGHSSCLFFRKSHTATMGTYVETVFSDILGALYFQGIASGGGSRGYAASMVVQQTGTAGTAIPSAFVFNTYSSTGVNTNSLTINSSGNVGIGTLASTDKLHIYSSDSSNSANVFLTFDRTSWSNFSNKLNNIVWADSKTRLGGIGVRYYSGTAYMDFHSLFNAGAKGDSDVVMTLCGDGTVGIGVTAPTYKLDVNGSINSATWHKSSRVGYFGTYLSSQVQGIWSIAENYSIDNSSANTWGSQYGIVYGYEASYSVSAPTRTPLPSWGHQLGFTVAGEANVRFSLSYGHAYFAGGVGIGTTSPFQQLDVSKSSAGGMGGIMQITNPNATKTNSTVELRFAPTDAADVRYSSIRAINDGGNIIDLMFITGAGSSITEKMRITGAGKVGIGIATPDTELEVYGAISAKLNSGTDGSYNLLIAGYQGLTNGTSNREFRIQQTVVSGSLNSYLVFNGHLSGTSPTFTQGNLGKFSSIKFDENGHINFLVNTGAAGSGSNTTITPTSAMIIRDTGRVGIGTTSPGYLLEVNGTTRLGGSSIIGSSGGNLSFFDGTARSRQAATKLTSSSTLKNAIDAFNSLLDALGQTSGYNLLNVS